MSLANYKKPFLPCQLEVQVQYYLCFLFLSTLYRIHFTIPDLPILPLVTFLFYSFTLCKLNKSKCSRLMFSSTFWKISPFKHKFYINLNFKKFESYIQFSKTEYPVLKNVQVRANLTFFEPFYSQVSFFISQLAALKGNLKFNKIILSIIVFSSFACSTH